MKTLHTIYSTFAKHNMAKFLTVLTMLLIVGIGQVLGATKTYTFTNKSWADSSNGWTSGKDGNGFTANQGVQVTTGASGANATTTTSFTNVSSVAVQYCTNTSKGKGTIKIQVGSNSAQSFAVTAPSSEGTTLKTKTFTFSPNQTGAVKISVDCTTNSIYIYSVTITTTDATTYTVTYNANGGSGTMSSSTGSSITISDCSFTAPNGKKFSKWNTEDDGSGTSYDPGAVVKEDLTLFAIWEDLPKYTVTLVPGSGSVTNTELEEPNAGKGVTLPEPTLSSACQSEGWSFAGWKTTSAVTTETTTKPTLIAAGTYKPSSDITLYAVYQRKETTEGGGSTTEETTKIYTFSNYTAGTQYAAETHVLDEYVTINIQNCHLTTQLRIYSSASNNGTVISNELPGRIVSMGFNMGYKTDKLLVYGSTNGTSWEPVGSISTTTSYKDYTLDFGETHYTYFKLDVEGTNQIRVASMSITWESTSDGGTTTTYYHSTPECATQTPTLTASTSPLAFDNVTVNSPKELEFTLSGSNLTANATLALSGTNASMFTVSPNSVTPSNGSITNQTITVTYTPTAKASHSAKLTISSTGAESIEIQLSGTGVAQMAYYTVNHYQQNLDGTYPSTPTDTEKKSGEVGTEVTPTVKTYPGFTAPSTNKTVTIKSDESTVVDYQYTRNSYTLTWDVNEGNALTGSYTSGSVKFGATITKPADPTRDGHIFKGWHNGSSIVTPETTMPANDLTYTAQWVKTHTITFYNNGIVYGTAQIVEDGNSVTLPTTPTSCDTEKYPHFYGWTETPINGVTATKPADLITASFTPTDNMELHAVFVDQLPQEGGWQVVSSVSELVAGKIYTIGSYGSPKSGVAMGEQKSNNRGTASWTTGTPVELTLGGSTGAWTLYDAAYNNGAGGYLYAASSSDNYLKTQATLNDNGRWAITISSNKAKIQAQGDKEKNIIRYNSSSSIFSCYSSGQNDIQLLTKSISSEPTAFITSCCETEAPTDGSIDGVEGSGNAMSVTLHWKDANDYKRYHVVCDELEIDEYVEKTDFETKGVQEFSECTTYIFKVSSAPKDGCESPVLEIEATPFIPKTIAFEDGANTTKQSTTCDSKSITVPTLTAQNCSTYVWIDEATGTEYTAGETITPAKDMTIVAKWSVITYTITFKDWDGTELQTSKVDCGTTPTYTGETPTKEADAVYQYTFAGWSPDIVPANGNATYTATYNKTKQIYTVEWYVNGKIAKTEQVEAEDYATAPDAEVPCGAVIAGWTDAEGGKYEHDSSTLHQGAKPSIQILSNKKFYAVFADIVE